MVVDDEEPLARMIGRTLQRLGYRVIALTSSTEALDLFRKTPQQFDLVVTDQTMLHMTGNRLAEEMAKIRSDIPIILCSGSEELPATEKAAPSVRKTIRKPFMDDELEKAVRTLLDAAKELKESG